MEREKGRERRRRGGAGRGGGRKGEGEGKGVSPSELRGGRVLFFKGDRLPREDRPRKGGMDIDRTIDGIGKESRLLLHAL